MTQTSVSLAVKNGGGQLLFVWWSIWEAKEGVQATTSHVIYKPEVCQEASAFYWWNHGHEQPLHVWQLRGLSQEEFCHGSQAREAETLDSSVAYKKVNIVLT